MKAVKLNKIVSGLAVATCIATATPTLAVERGGLDETGPYTVVENWFKPGVPRWNQPITSVVVDTPDRILIASADEHVSRPGSLVLGPDSVPEKSPSVDGDCATIY